MVNEYLLIDKVGDFFYFNKLSDIEKYLNLSKSQVCNIYRQSIKHYNKYTNHGYYIQRLYNDPTRPPKLLFPMNRFIYYVNNDGSTQYGETVEI